ncbi:MAG: hypothetical protein V1676_06400 [Candidatus Diapherotrites archaeon]
MERVIERKIFIALVLAFLILRLLIASTSLELFDYEECVRGTVALELMRGLRMPYFDYMWVPYDGAGLSLPFLIAPFFALFGVSGFTLKLMMLFTFSLGTFALICLISRRYFGKKTAIAASLLALLSPPLFTVRGLISQHAFEDTFLTLLMMFLFFRIFYGGRSRARDFAAFGIASGFSLWFGGMTAGMLITCIIFWLAIDRGFFLRRNFAVFSASFLAGFSPAIYYALAYGTSVFVQARAVFVSGAGERLAALPAKTANYILVELPASLNFRALLFLDGWMLNCIYYAVFLLSLLLVAFSLFGKARHSGGIKSLLPAFPIAFFIIYSAGYLLGSFTVNPEFGGKGFRYFVPLLPFMFIIIAQAFSLLTAKAGVVRLPRWAAPAAFAAICLLLLAGLASNLALIKPGNLNFGGDSVYRPYCYGWLAKKPGGMHGADIPAALEQCGKFDAQNRAHCYWGLGQGIGYGEIFAKRCAGTECNSSERLESAISRCAAVPAEYRKHCHSGIVWGIAMAYGRDIETANAMCGVLDGVCADCCAETLAAYIPQSPETCAMLSPRYRNACYFELGAISGACTGTPAEFYGDCTAGAAYISIYRRGPVPAEFSAMCTAFGSTHSADCCAGIIRALDELYYEFPEKKAAILRSAGAEFAAQCKRG